MTGTEGSLTLPQLQLFRFRGARGQLAEERRRPAHRSEQPRKPLGRGAICAKAGVRGE